MRIARVVGQVTLNRCHPSIQGLPLKVAVPLSLAELRQDAAGAAEELVVLDQLSAGHGQLFMLTEGGEAAQPFWPDQKPVDAYNAALIDHLHFDRRELGEH